MQGEEVGDKHAARRLGDLARALAQFFWFSGRWDERVQLSTHAFEGMRALKEWSKAGWCAYDVAWIFYNRNDTEEFARWTDRSNKAWKGTNSKWEEATGIRMRGLMTQQKKDYDSAKRLFQDALAINRDINSDENVAAVLNSLAEIERLRRRYDVAESYYREALAMAEELTSTEKQAYISGNLGLLALNRERWAEALEWFEKELSLAQQVGRLDLIASAKRGLARVHEEEGHPDLALSLAQEALVIYERLRHRDLEWAQALVERLMEKVGGG